MSRRRKIKCSQCNKDLFYMPSGYSMAFKVVCCDCDKGKTKNKTIRTATTNFATAVKGVREDIHPEYSFRSRTEANVARIFNLLGIKWEYENKLFKFPGYKNKPHQYLMDFEIIKSNSKSDKLGIVKGYIEVKGYMNGQSRSKLKRLKKHYPKDFNKTTIIIYNSNRKKDVDFCKKLGIKYLCYNELEKQFKDKIDKWE